MQADCSGASDQQLKIWDIHTGEEQLNLAGHAGWVMVCTVSPDGHWIASGSNDKMMYIWDARTGKVLLKINHGGENIAVCVVSPGGKCVKSILQDYLGLSHEKIQQLVEINAR